MEDFYNEQLEAAGASYSTNEDGDEDEIPALIRERPMHIRDVALSKFHSAVLTNDPVSNLYVCGLGRGGRLGLGDENTRFRFVPVQGPLAGRHISHIALGQYHTLAVVGNGELWSWGSNLVSQLGYTLPTPPRADEEPMGLTPRQVFGPLKKEFITGIAASAVHSVAHTSTSLYCWGRNLGQLGLMDADSRSLEIQPTPRKVAASLISTPILMVSAIDKATTCLLASNTVFVFTSYGYNIVKFPAPDIFVNTRLGASKAPSSHRNLNQIKAVTSGGEAIAALSMRGDLYLMNLNHHVDTMSSTSTTNPAKIKKGAVSQPQCIWSARKEGVTSFGVGEHGSVIISTESGAVWRRVKRAKAKGAAAPGSDEIKRKDFKFQRVPGITNAVNVRSSAFGAFAAVRRDCTSVAGRIKIVGQTLWDDMSSLCPFEDFESSDPPPTNNAKSGKKFWGSEVDKKKIGRVAYQVLKSPDLESDLAPYLDMLRLGDAGFDAVVSTTSAPDLKIPIHGWVLGARSTVLRNALATFQDDGVAEVPEVLKIDCDSRGQASLTFYGLDIVTLLNLIVYVYRDEVIPAWNYLREVPHMSFRYRQVRVELMKLATRLNMMKLEAGARLQSRVTKSLDQDFKLAVQDDMFLESGDALLELDGVEVPVHSHLVRQRCPFFNALFGGRSQGQWVAERMEDQDDDERVRVDLAHFDPRAFRYVLLHLYADVGLELFDDTVSADVDEFSELVMEVMSIANELMLDRLAQICQHVISRFVTTRNISYLLNEISPCAVPDFKDAGLEYACLHMEMMLENHLLDDLDDDLIRELDEIVRENQLARAPFSRSGRAEMVLHERYPELVEDIEEERRRRAKEIAWKATHKDDERKVSLSHRTKFGSFEDGLPASPLADKSRRRSRAAVLETSTPPLRSQVSQGDMMFSMDEDTLECPESPSLRPANRGASKAAAKEPEAGSFRSGSQAKRQPLDLWGTSAQSSLTPTNKEPSRDAKSGSPWARAPPLPVDKLDLRSIMFETSAPGPSGITAGLAAVQKCKDAPTPSQTAAAAAAQSSSSQKPTPTKMSQKERKRQQQLEASQRAAAELAAQEQQPRRAWDNAQAEASKGGAPWKVAGAPKTSLKDVMATTAVAGPASSSSSSSRAAPSGSGPVKPLVAAETAKSAPRRTASPDTRFAGQTRRGTSPPPPPAAAKLTPHSRTYITPARKAEPSLGLLSMEDIIGQQRREREAVKEAVAKRPLEEIQQEQAFQEWWDAESRRTQEEEARRVAGADRGKGRRRGGRGKGRGGEERPRGEGQAKAQKGDARPKAQKGEAQPKAQKGESQSRGQKSEAQPRTQRGPHSRGEKSVRGRAGKVVAS